MIEKLKQLANELLAMPETFIHYYDDLYGYPWGRYKLLGMLLLGFAFWFTIINLVFTKA